MRIIAALHQEQPIKDSMFGPFLWPEQGHDDGRQQKLVFEPADVAAMVNVWLTEVFKVRSCPTQLGK